MTLKLRRWLALGGAALTLGAVPGLAAPDGVPDGDSLTVVPGASGTAADPVPPGMPPATTPEKPAGGAEKKPPAPPRPVELILAPAFGHDDLTGSRAEFSRYQRLPRGFYLGLLQALRKDEKGAVLQQIWWRNLGESDQKGYLDLTSQRYPAYLRLWRDTTDFFGDPRSGDGRYSQRDNTRIRLKAESAGPGPLGTFQFWEQRESIPELLRLAPQPGVGFTSRDYDFLGVIPVGKGTVRFEPRFRDTTSTIGRTPSSSSSWLGGEILYPITDRADLTAGFQQVRTAVDGREDATWNILRTRGRFRGDGGLLVEAFFRQQTADLPFTLTSYAERNSIVGLDAAVSPLRRVTLRGGLYREDIRYNRGYSGGTDDASWLGGWMHFRASDPERWSLNIRFDDRGLDGAPITTIPGLTSRDSLFYSRNTRVDTRLDYFPFPRLSTYLDYLWQWRSNDERETRVSLNSFSLGAVSPLSDRLVATLEYSQQRWDGSTAPLRSGPGGPAGDLPPRLFFSDGRVLTAGLDYRLSPRSSLDLTYNQYSSTGGQSSRDYFAVLQYRRDVGPSLYYSVGYQYENFRDARRKTSFTAFPFILQVGYRKEFR